MVQTNICKMPAKRRRRRRNRKKVHRHQPGFAPQVEEPKREKEENLGAKIGREVGSWAHGALKSLFGSGDYKVEHEHTPYDVAQNSIVGEEASEPALASPMTSAPAVPLINDVRDGEIRIRHREFITDYNASIAPAVSLFRLNPTSSTTFPYLSGIASQFEQWIPHGIVFECVSSCGNAVSSTNASLGTCSMATQYNSVETGFQSKSQLLNHYYASSAKTSENLMHPVECAPRDVPTRVFWTDPVDQAVGFEKDDRLDNLGYTFVWREGSQASYIAGELWVTYDITLLKPRIPASPVAYPSVRQLAEWLEEKMEHGDESRTYDPSKVPDPTPHPGKVDDREYVNVEPLLHKIAAHAPPRIRGRARPQARLR